MVPDIEVRLAAMVRAMREVIIPAIDPEALPAMDQAQIVAGTLDMLVEQCPRLFDFAMAEAFEFAELADELLALTERGKAVDPTVRGAGQRLVSEARPLMQAPIPSYVDLRDLVRRLKSVVDELVESTLAQAPDLAPALAEAVLRQAWRQAARERAWNKGSGFDAAELEPLDDLLATPVRANG